MDFREALKITIRASNLVEERCVGMGITKMDIIPILQGKVTPEVDYEMPKVVVVMVTFILVRLGYEI